VLTIGSLCTGIAGLDHAVANHWNAGLVWVSDDNAQVSQFLATRFPEVPNLGDFRTHDPATVEVPDILTAGFPCQSVSVAGRHEGTASDYWLFDDIVKFIEGLRSRPTWMVLENVRNLLSHDDGRTAHRVFREVARLGFDLNYGVVRASDAGLPHKRERFFAVATHADGERLQEQPAGPLSTPPQLSRPSRPHGHNGFDFGPYEPAIRQAEAATGIQTPAPVDGKGLRPEFAAWCMGFPPPWTTGLGLSRNQQLKMIGNAVAPPQAALALELLTT